MHHPHQVDPVKSISRSFPFFAATCFACSKSVSHSTRSAPGAAEHEKSSNAETATCLQRAINFSPQSQMTTSDFKNDARQHGTPISLRVLPPSFYAIDAIWHLRGPRATMKFHRSMEDFHGDPIKPKASAYAAPPHPDASRGANGCRLSLVPCPLSPTPSLTPLPPDAARPCR